MRRLGQWNDMINVKRKASHSRVMVGQNIEVPRSRYPAVGVGECGDGITLSGMVIVVAMAMAIAIAMVTVVVMVMVWLFSHFAIEHQFSHPFIRQGDTSKDLLQKVDGSKVSISVARKSKAGCHYVVTSRRTLRRRRSQRKSRFIPYKSWRRWHEQCHESSGIPGCWWSTTGLCEVVS